MPMSSFCVRLGLVAVRVAIIRSNVTSHRGGDGSDLRMDGETGTADRQQSCGVVGAGPAVNVDAGVGWIRRSRGIGLGGVLILSKRAA